MTSSISIDPNKAINLLKKGLLDERKKTSELETEIAKLKEDNVTKQENIDKLKEELNQYRNSSKGKQIGRFFTNLFDEQKDEKSENDELKDLEIEKLKKNILTLKEEIKKIKNEKENLEKNYEENKKILEEKNENFIKEIENNKKEFNIQIQKLENEINIKNKNIYENNERNRILTEYVKNFDVQKLELEKMINKYKFENENYKNEINNLKNLNDKFLKDNSKLINEKKDYINNTMTDKKKIEQLQVEINQYKILIQELTPIPLDYTFVGNIIYNNNIKKKVELNFGKIENKLYWLVEGEKEFYLFNNEILNMQINNNDKTKITIILKINKNKELYNCQFTEKEIEYIYRFYLDFKNKPGKYENALLNISLGDYFY